MLFLILDRYYKEIQGTKIDIHIFKLNYFILEVQVLKKDAEWKSTLKN